MVVAATTQPRQQPLSPGGWFAVSCVTRQDRLSVFHQPSSVASALKMKPSDLFVPGSLTVTRPTMAMRKTRKKLFGKSDGFLFERKLSDWDLQWVWRTLTANPRVSTFNVSSIISVQRCCGSCLFDHPVKPLVPVRSCGLFGCFEQACESLKMPRKHLFRADPPRVVDDFLVDGPCQSGLWYNLSACSQLPP